MYSYMLSIWVYNSSSYSFLARTSSSKFYRYFSINLIWSSALYHKNRTRSKSNYAHKVKLEFCRSQKQETRPLTKHLLSILPSATRTWPAIQISSLLASNLHSRPWSHWLRLPRPKHSQWQLQIPWHLLTLAPPSDDHVPHESACSGSHYHRTYGDTRCHGLLPSPDARSGFEIYPAHASDHLTACGFVPQSSGPSCARWQALSQVEPIKPHFTDFIVPAGVAPRATTPCIIDTRSYSFDHRAALVNLLA